MLPLAFSSPDTYFKSPSSIDIHVWKTDGTMFEKTEDAYLFC